MKRAARRQAGKPCKTCGEVFQPERGNEKFCSARCKSESLHPYKAGREISHCVICGNEYARSHSVQKTCSVECRKVLKNEWKRQNPRAALSMRIRTGMRRAIRERKAGRSWESLVGYTLDDLMQHIERQFQPGMSWERMSDWHIDHVRPLASFELETMDSDKFREAWALENLQPLWDEDNMRKGTKYGAPEKASGAQGAVW